VKTETEQERMWLFCPYDIALCEVVFKSSRRR